MNTQTIATQPVELINWNSRRPQRGPTCACGRNSYCDNSCNTFASVETITVGQDGNVWRWYRNPVHGLRKYSQEAFGTIDAAIAAAQSVARCDNAIYAGVEVAR